MTSLQSLLFRTQNPIKFYNLSIFIMYMLLISTINSIQNFWKTSYILTWVLNGLDTAKRAFNAALHGGILEVDMYQEPAMCNMAPRNVCHLPESCP